MDISTLTTAHLVLRPFREANVPAIERLLSTPEIPRQTRGFPHPLPAGWAIQWVQRHPRLAAENRRLHWAIADREDRVIGAVSLSLRLDERLADLGYWMGVDSWGQGYTTEACISVREYAFGPLGLERLEASCLPDNRASARVLEKTGMSF
jgi:RimJ/RimL family protein N-acetyltransferase